MLQIFLAPGLMLRVSVSEILLQGFFTILYFYIHNVHHRNHIQIQISIFLYHPFLQVYICAIAVLDGSSCRLHLAHQKLCLVHAYCFSIYLQGACWVCEGLLMYGRMHVHQTRLMHLCVASHCKDVFSHLCSGYWMHMM